jgi:hypothetical protein
MTALVQALSGTATTTDMTLKTIVIFCCTGLVVSLLCATHGLDLSPGFF